MTRRRLSLRERQVIDRLREGKNYKAIGYELRIAEATARTLGSRALRKMGKTRLALILRT